MGESGKEDSVCGNATKGAAKEEASASHWKKGVGDREKVEESGRRRSSMRDQAARSTIRRRRSMKEKPSACLTMESAGALWRGHS